MMDPYASVSAQEDTTSTETIKRWDWKHEWLTMWQGLGVVERWSIYVMVGLGGLLVLGIVVVFVGKLIRLVTGS